MERENKPQISVVLPVYNGMAYLKESVESVLKQEESEVDFEFLICDDCSKDQSYEYLKSINNPRIQLFRNEKNKGLFPTLNYLIKKANADLVHLWAQDDIMLKDCLRETVQFHKDFPEVNFSFSRLQGIDAKGNLLKTPKTFDNKILTTQGHAISSLLFGSIAGNIANVCIVKEACKAVGYFDESMIYVGDYKMWCQLAKNAPVGMNGKVLVNVRQHTGQLSKNLDASFYRMKENYEVYHCFLDTLKPDLRRQLEKTIKWKVYPSYFNQYVYILKQKRFDLAKKYLSHLKSYDSIPKLSMRWLVLRILNILSLKDVFFERFFLRKIRNLK